MTFTPITRRRRRLVGIASASAVAMLLTACSPASPGDDEPLPISVVLAPIHFETAYIAEEQGFFDEEGLDVTLVPGGDPAANLAQLTSGQAQFATSAGASVITATAAGVDLEIILGNEGISPTEVTSGLVSRPGSGIESMADMDGRTVAVLGLSTGAEIQLFLAAEDAGVDWRSIDLVVTPLPAMVEAVENGHVDTALVFPPFFDAAIGAGLTVVGTPTTDYGANSPATAWVATGAYIEENPEVVERFRSAMTKAIDHYNDNHEDARRILGENSELPPAALAARVFVERHAEIHLEALQTLIDAMVQFEQVSEPLDAEELLATGTPTR